MLRATGNTKANQLFEQAIRAEFRSIEEAANYYLQLLDLGIETYHQTIHDRLIVIGEDRHTKSSLYVLGVMQLTNEDNQAAIKTLKRSFNKGSEKAAALLANIYLEKDVEKGLYYLQKSITQDNLERTLKFIKSYADHHPNNINIGYLYGLALSHPLNKGEHHDEAMRYFMRAAKNPCTYRQQACLELVKYYRYTNKAYLAENTVNILQNTFIAVARLVPVTTERTATELLITLEKGQLTQPEKFPWYNMRAAVHDFHDFITIMDNLIPTFRSLLETHLKQDLQRLYGKHLPQNLSDLNKTKIENFKNWLFRSVKKEDDALLHDITHSLYNIPTKNMEFYSFFNAFQEKLQACCSDKIKNEGLKNFSKSAQEYIQAATEIWLQSRQPTYTKELLTDCNIEKPYPIPTKSNLMYVPDEISSTTTRLLTAMPPQAAIQFEKEEVVTHATTISDTPTTAPQQEEDVTETPTSHVRLVM